MRFIHIIDGDAQLSYDAQGNVLWDRPVLALRVQDDEVATVTDHAGLLALLRRDFKDRPAVLAALEKAHGDKPGGPGSKMAAALRWLISSPNPAAAAWRTQRRCEEFAPGKPILPSGPFS